MKRILVILIPFALAASSVIAQKEESKYVEFSYRSDRHNKPVTSLYNKIDFLDSRADSTSIGILDSGSKKIVRAVLKTPVQPQLDDVLQRHCAPNSGDGELLFQLRRFSFSETRGTRYCYLAASLYARKGEKYFLVSNLNTTLSMNDPGTILESLQDEENAVMNQFIGQSIGLVPKDSVVYDWNDLSRIDSIEKRQLPVYNTATYREGCYSDYSAFKEQTPDVSGTVVTNPDGSIKKVKFNDRRWKEEKYLHIYAIVFKGIPYVVAHSGYYPLEKVGDDFYFTGKLRINATAGELAGGYIALGLVGRAIVSNEGDRNVYRVLIDHQNGEFIHLQVLARTAN